MAADCPFENICVRTTPEGPPCGSSPEQIDPRLHPSQVCYDALLNVREGYGLRYAWGDLELSYAATDTTERDTRLDIARDKFRVLSQSYNLQERVPAELALANFELFKIDIQDGVEEI
jgi:hypothetical protein